MDMKKLLNIVSESKQVNECGMNMPNNPIPSVPPVTMNVSMNAQGIDQIKELIKLVSVAQEQPQAQAPMMAQEPMPVLSIAPPEAAKQPDLDDLSKEVGMDADAVKSDVKTLALPKPEGQEEPEQKSPLGKMADEVRDMADELAKENEDAKEGYANSPDEKYADMDAVDPHGNDLHKEKKSYSDKPFRGDNPMAVEQLKRDLANMYQHIKETR